MRGITDGRLILVCVTRIGILEWLLIQRLQLRIRILGLGVDVRHFPIRPETSVHWIPLVRHEFLPMDNSLCARIRSDLESHSIGIGLSNNMGAGKLSLELLPLGSPALNEHPDLVSHMEISSSRHLAIVFSLLTPHSQL
jgi:hypothetical protein